jgi:hypothetical protein
MISVAVWPVDKPNLAAFHGRAGSVSGVPASARRRSVRACWVYQRGWMVNVVLIQTASTDPATTLATAAVGAARA